MSNWLGIKGMLKGDEKSVKRRGKDKLGAKLIGIKDLFEVG